MLDTTHYHVTGVAQSPAAAVFAAAFVTGSDSAEVAWSETRTDLVGSVTIEQSSSDDGGTTWSEWEELDTVGSTACTYAVSGLEAGMQYKFQVTEVPDDSNATAGSSQTYAIQTACVLWIDVSAETTDLTMTYDADGDGIADYEDGYIADSEAGFGADDVTDTSNWVPITITISGANSANAALNREALLNARLTFSYDAEDIQSSYADDYVPSGRLRLWKTNSAARIAADFIAADTEYGIYDLSGDPGATTMNLWVENFSVFEDVDVAVTLTQAESQSSTLTRSVVVGNVQTQATSQPTTQAAVEFHSGKYDASALRHWISTDTGYGTRVTFLLDQVDQWNRKAQRFTFAVSDLSNVGFHGTSSGATVDTAATSVAEAMGWAINALREFARAGVGDDNYFNIMTRAWARWAPGNNDAAVCLGTTLDWLYFFSWNASDQPTSRMYPADSSTSEYNLFHIYNWVFSGKSDPIWHAYKSTKAEVNIPADPGMNERYWDEEKGGGDDQTHHFAGYFAFGGLYGNDRTQLNVALWHTGDYRIRDGTIQNHGDYYLGIMAADIGAWYTSHPGYMGDWITAQLKAGTL